MNKLTLSEQALYYGNVKMPKGFEINHDKLLGDIIKLHLYLVKSGTKQIDI